MKYKFSTIERITGEWGYQRKTQVEYIGKYMCQVFDENNQYVKVLIGNTYEEVHQMQKEMNKTK